jgi:hypothetical protein
MGVFLPQRSQHKTAPLANRIILMGRMGHHSQLTWRRPVTSSSRSFVYQVMGVVDSWEENGPGPSKMGDSEDVRAKLGIRLVMLSAIALVVFAIVVMVSAAFAQSAAYPRAMLDAAQLLVTSLLPLFGTWVGTVLAFYFSKENFEAANRGTLDLVRSVAQRLNTTPVINAMMPRDRMIVLEVPRDGAIDSVALAEVLSKFETIGANGQRISRLPILGSNGECVGILHRGVWAEMLSTAMLGRGECQGSCRLGFVTSCLLS